MKVPRLPRLPSDGWRQTAVINTSIVGLLLVVNLSTLAGSVAKSGVSGNNVFSKGSCSRISTLNTFLHLLLNIASSLIIASSNFFMQVLNSPTRAEVDRAHARKQWLEIGVPSLRNVMSVSPYKSLAWVLFSLSSIPIHLLFNSSVFTVDYSGSDWSMAIVSESLLGGATYSLPGAALTLEGTECALPKYLDPEVGTMLNGGGYDFGYDDFDFQNSSHRLAEIMVNATQRLSVSDCKSEYQTCQGLHKYRSLVLVVDSGDEPTDSKGWNISDIYNMEETVGNIYNVSGLELSDDELQNQTFSSIWEPYFEDASMSQSNSLWFSSACYKRADQVDTASPDGCSNSCTGPLGISWSNREKVINETEVKSSDWEFPWLRAGDSVSALQSRDTWGQVFDNTTWFTDPYLWPNKCIGIPRPPYRESSANNIRVKYCLAEPMEPGCKVALSNPLLLVVTICILIKLVLSVCVVYALRDDPLVTPGDAVASFMICPDPVTVGRCAAPLMDIQYRPERNPLQWQARSRRLAHTISPEMWIMNYVFFALLLAALGTVMKGAFYYFPLSNVSSVGSMFSHEKSMLMGGVFSADWFPTGNFLASVLLPNTPQLILSCAYFAYNAIYTRLLTESEWQSFSMGYRPLRVTHPQGEQWSTFRLQLPYRYSIPLLVTSTFLHWVTSNAIFLFMSEGGYYSGLAGTEDDHIALVGYSSPSILLGFIVSLILVIMPLLLGLRRLRGSMTISRSNSLIMSAACHVSTFRNVDSHSRKSVSRVKDDYSLDERVEDTESGDDWGRRTVSAMSASVEESIELQHLMAADRSSSQNTAVVESSGEVEERPLLSSWRKKPNFLNTHSDVSQNGTTATSEDSTTYTERLAVNEGDAHTESQRLMDSTPANNHGQPSTMRSFDAGDTDNTLQAARELEDGSISEEDDKQFRTGLSRSKIRWGVVRMPEEFYAQFGDREDGVELGHLTFGTEEQGVAPPVNDPAHVYI